MKNSIIYFVVIGLLIAGTSCQQGGSKSVKLETELDSVSYAMGVWIGLGHKQQIEKLPGASDLNSETILAAFRATINGSQDTSFTEGQNNQLLQSYFDSAKEVETQKNLEEGNAFLEQNKARDGIIITESGLQYEILTAGTGEKPTAQDQVRVHYHGTLIDGTVFESSVDKGEPSVFGVGQVIAGWTEALQLMPVGSKWKVFLPSNIAYGERGGGPGSDIGPNTALIFEIELLEIVRK